ncbi:MAG: lipopolysaccharide heptosyltransferase I [Nitrospiraceae bacterium]
MNILIVKTSAIGDVTHTLPALNAIRAHYPDAHITWVVEEAAADIVEGHLALNRVLVSLRKSWFHALKGGKIVQVIREVSRFITQLRDTHYDLLIDFQGLLKSSLWVMLAKADRKVGFGRGMEHAECSYLFLNERVPAVDMNRHALERELVLLEGMGIPCQSVVYEFTIPKENMDEASALLRENGLAQGDHLVAINPMTKWPTKLWEHKRFAEVADRLIKEGIRVAFTGSLSDRDAIDQICRHMVHEAIRLDGKTSLKTLAALYQRSRVVLSTDSGPMHIAAAVGTPVIALFGPTAPWRTGPYGPQHTVLRAGVTCSPCFKKRCLTTEYEEMACLQRITVEQVVETVLQKLDASPTLTPDRVVH